MWLVGPLYPELASQLHADLALPAPLKLVVCPETTVHGNTLLLCFSDLVQVFVLRGFQKSEGMRGDGAPAQMAQVGARRVEQDTGQRAQDEGPGCAALYGGAPRVHLRGCGPGQWSLPYVSGF